MDGPDINSPFAQALIQQGQQRGYTPFDISGHIGNAYSENGLRTSGLPGDNGTAFGGMQWRKERVDALKAEAQRMGKDWTDPSVQASHWLNEQDAAGSKGADNIFDANNSTIDSLRPGGWKANADNNEGVMHYAKRLDASKAAYKSMTGQDAFDDSGDYPGAGAQNASAQGVPPGAEGSTGVMNQSQQPQDYQPTLTDNLKSLSAAFLRRDSPNAAAQIDNSLQAKINQQQAFLKAQQASDKWSTGGAYQNKADQWVQDQTSADGRRRTVPVAENAIPKADPDPAPTRQEQVARDGQSLAYTNFHAIDNVRGAVDKLRDALASGKMQLGPDLQVKMLAQNFTGNSDENARDMKSMESNLIAAASVVAQAQKGAMTNFKFMKDLELVMPSFAKFDNKAAYESLTRVTDGMHATMTGLANSATSAGKSYSRLRDVMDPLTTDQVDAGKYFGGKIKSMNEAEETRKATAVEFMKTPGRAGAAAAAKGPSVGFTKNGFKFNGGDPSNEANWQKVD